MARRATNGAIDLVHGDLTREIIGAFYEIYREVGYGFFEAVYQRALPPALAARGIACATEVPLAVRFRGELIGEYRADLIVDGRVVVETKVAAGIVDAHEMQCLNYLRAANLRVGLVLNFGPRPSFRRLLL